MILENKTTLISSFTALFLVCIKLTIGAITGSMAIIASGIDSALDMVISLINFLVLKESQKPSDENHQFGHGKLQGFGAIIEGIIIFASGILILYYGINKIIHGIPLQKIDLSIYVMLFSLIITGILVKIINNAVRKTENIILKADLMHYKVDLLSNLGIIISLLIIKFTGLVIIDPIISIFIAIYIIIGSIKVIQQGVDVLMDKCLEIEKINYIKNLIESSNKKIISYHKLLTRQSGHNIFIQFHIVFEKNISLWEAHEIADKIEKKITTKFENAMVTIHLDPYDDNNL